MTRGARDPTPPIPGRSSPRTPDADEEPQLDLVDCPDRCGSGSPRRHLVRTIGSQLLRPTGIGSWLPDVYESLEHFDLVQSRRSQDGVRLNSGPGQALASITIQPATGGEQSAGTRSFHYGTKLIGLVNGLPQREREREKEPRLPSVQNRRLPESRRCDSTC